MICIKIRFLSPPTDFQMRQPLRLRLKKKSTAICVSKHFLDHIPQDQQILNESDYLVIFLTVLKRTRVQKMRGCSDIDFLSFCFVLLWFSFINYYFCEKFSRKLFGKTRKGWSVELSVMSWQEFALRSSWLLSYEFFWRTIFPVVRKIYLIASKKRRKKVSKLKTLTGLCKESSFSVFFCSLTVRMWWWLPVKTWQFL